MTHYHRRKSHQSIKIASLKKGITFLSDEKGDRKAIQFNLANKDVRELMEDLFDTIVAEERINEPEISFTEIKKSFLQRKKNQKAKA